MYVLLILALGILMVEDQSVAGELYNCIWDGGSQSDIGPIHVILWSHS